MIGRCFLACALFVGIFAPAAFSQAERTVSDAELSKAIDTLGSFEFTVRTDGSTGDIVVTNSNPRRTFDSVAVNAVEQWRYKPVMRNGKAVEQRASVRLRFTQE